MFALEIDFHDGISSPETILVRRSNALVGTSDQAHVVVEGAPSGTPEIRLIRGLGAEFRCELGRRSGQLPRSFAMLEGTYRRTAELKVGEVTLRATVLDLDLALLPDETPDRAAVRVLRSALSRPSPVFPAIAVVGPHPVFLSFPADQPLLVGRSRKCGLRLDSVDVSGEHARFGLEAGKLWVEDLGSTNGTFVDGEQISGRRFLERDQRVSIGSGYVLAPILGPEDVASASRIGPATVSSAAPAIEEGYPCLVSLTELVRPARFVLRGQGTLRVGRDPASDIWINAPHISRQHLILRWTRPGEVEVVDTSSNGTYLRGERLPKNDAVGIAADGIAILDFCSGVTVALCHSLDEEAGFVNRRPNPAAPLLEQQDQELPEYDEDFRPARSRTSTENRALDSWANTVHGLADEPPKGPSVFEQLVERNRNQALPPDEAASEEGVNDVQDSVHLYEHDIAQTGFFNRGQLEADSAALAAAEQHVPRGSNGDPARGEVPALSGILDSEGLEAKGFADSEHPDLSFEDEQYEGIGGELPRDRGVLRIVLRLAVVALFGVSVLLLLGLFSDSLFY